jgi:hypothetical protein
MNHTFVYYKCFEVNGTLILANDIDEAIAIHREYEPKEEIRGAHICRDGDYCLAKIATKEDIRKCFREEEGSNA